MIPKPQRDEQGRVQGEFYPLQKAELIALRKAKLINNAAFVHLALRYENPYCDRPITVIPKEFALRWLLPESSVYEAIAKLKEASAINIRSGRITIQWADSQQDEPNDSQQTLLVDSQQDEPNDSQQEDNSENPEKFWESRKNSENPEKILETQKKFWKPRKNSGSSENRCSKPASDKDSSALQTIQTYSDFSNSLSEAERENFEKFVRDSWKKITAKNGEPGEEIVSLERFLHKPEDLNNWWQKFLNSPEGRQAKKKAATTGHDWYNDPRFNEWIWAAFERGYEWVHENEAEREVRQAFYDWAFAVNAFEGVCV